MCTAYCKWYNRSRVGCVCDSVWGQHFVAFESASSICKKNHAVNQTAGVIQSKKKIVFHVSQAAPLLDIYNVRQRSSLMVSGSFRMLDKSTWFSFLKTKGTAMKRATAG